MNTIYLLPWSSKQSAIDLFGEGPSLSFPELDPFRRNIIDGFNLNSDRTSPVWRRYKGKFWEELCVWTLPEAIKKKIESRGVVFSPAFGMIKAGDLIPRYNVSWENEFNGETLRSFWKDKLRDFTEVVFKDSLIFDFLSQKEREMVKFPQSSVRVVFEYYKKGKRVINTLPHRAYTLRYIAEWEISTDTLSKINFLDYKVKDIKEGDKVIKVIMESEGKYI